jgi:outer membrane protein assembly factor BamB
VPIARPSRRPKSHLLVPALAIFLLAAVGCARISNPDGWAGPTLADDMLYLTTDNGEISAVNPDGFTVEWTFPATEEVVCADSPQPRKIDLDGIYGAAQVDDGQVYVGAYDGNVYALDRENGACNWVFETDDPIIGGLTLVEGDLYVPSEDNSIYLLDSADGSQVASFDAGDSIWVTPLVDDGAVYITTVGGLAYALDADTLEPLWDEPFSVKAGLISDPVIADDTLIVGGIGETLYALDAATGDEQWSFGGGNWFWAKPLVDGGVVYAPDLDGNLFALDLDGSAVWPAPFEAENSIRSSPVIVDGSLIVIDTKGNAYGVDTAEGIGLWPAPAVLKKTVHSNPIVVDDGVFVVAQGGDFFQFNSDGGGLREIEVAA